LQTWFSLGAAYWIPTFMVRKHNYSIQEIGLVLGICTVIFGVAGVLTAGWLSAKFIQYGRRDGPILVGMYYSAGLMVCGIIGCLAPSNLVSIVFIGVFSKYVDPERRPGGPANDHAEPDAGSDFSGLFAGGRNRRRVSRSNVDGNGNGLCISS
jgi:MFS family permease